MILHFIMLAAVVASSDTLHIRFVGNAAFELSDGTTTLLMDFPYESGAFGLTTYEFAAVDPRGFVVSVITHGHADHFDRGLFLGQDWLIVGPKEVTAQLAPERVIPLTDTVSVGSFRIVRYETPHAEMEHYAYLVLWGDRRLYFTGDTDDPSNLLAMQGLDVAFVTPWLTCEVAARDGRIQTEALILQHHYEGMDERVCLEPRIPSQGEGIVLLSVDH